MQRRLTPPLLALGLPLAALPACNRDSLDGDGDGFTELTNDCDDSDPNVHPDAVEVCDNGIDDNCNGETDELGATSGRIWYADLDGDGYGDEGITIEACSQPENYAPNKWDCNESDPAINPGAQEVCDAIDNDCDGEVDETTAADAQTWHPDRDGDGFGDADSSYAACESPGEGWIQDGSDCNDEDPLVSPEQTESCLTPVDDDCDGLLNSDDAFGCTDYYADLDGDGHPGSRACLCAADDTYAATEATDCDDSDPLVFPGAGAEDAGWVDRDCDGIVIRSLADADLTFAVSDIVNTSGSPVRALSWAAGDLDGDGLDDLSVATAPRYGTGGGAILVASGATMGSQQDLHETATAVLATSSSGAFGDEVQRGESGHQPHIVDLDSDGLGDLVVLREVGIAVGDGTQYAYEASVFLGPVSGTLDLLAADATLQIEKSASPAYSRNLRAAGQWGDGRPLLAVSDLWGGDGVSATNGGLVSLLAWDASTSALAVVGDITGVNTNQYLGHEVGDAGDLDGDGLADRVVTSQSTHTSDPFGTASSSLGGVVELFTDQTGIPDTSIVSNAYYGRIVEHLGGPGDLNGDGHNDVVFSAWDSNIGATQAGRVHVVFGPVGSGVQELVDQHQAVIRGNRNRQYVDCPAVLPDANGDGRDDLAVGANGEYHDSGARGSTYVWLGEDLDATLEAGTDMVRLADGLPDGLQAHGFCNWQYRASGSAGDVNGDGLGDLLVRGAADESTDPTKTISLFVFLGEEL